MIKRVEVRVIDALCSRGEGFSYCVGYDIVELYGGPELLAQTGLVNSLPLVYDRCRFGGRFQVRGH